MDRPARFGRFVLPGRPTGPDRAEPRRFPAAPTLAAANRARSAPDAGLVGVQPYAAIRFAAA